MLEENSAREQDAQPAPDAPPPVPPAAVPDHAQPARPNEAASEIALFDAFAEPVETPAPAETVPPSAAIADAHAASDAMPEVVTIPEAAEAPVQDTVSEAIDAAPKTPVENPREAIVSPQAAPITSRHGRTAASGAVRTASASAALPVAGGCGGPLCARLRRVHPPDRRAHRRRLRPPLARDRRRVSHSTPMAAWRRRLQATTPGPGSP